MTGLPDIEKQYSGELVRKAIHLSSLSIPIAYSILGRETTLAILIPVTALFFATDVARLLVPSVRTLYHRSFGWILRAHERNDESRRLNGATYVLLSACLCIWIFPPVIAITSFSILIISDTIAALIGRRFGRKPFLGKTWEGTLAFIVSALLVVLAAPKAAGMAGEYAIGGVGAIVGAIVEALPPVVDDNISIPLSIGLTMWILYVLFLPGLDISPSV